MVKSAIIYILISSHLLQNVHCDPKSAVSELASKFMGVPKALKDIKSAYDIVDNAFNYIVNQDQQLIFFNQLKESTDTLTDIMDRASRELGIYFEDADEFFNALYDEELNPTDTISNLRDEVDTFFGQSQEIYSDQTFESYGDSANYITDQFSTTSDQLINALSNKILWHYSFIVVSYVHLAIQFETYKGWSENLDLYEEDLLDLQNKYFIPITKRLNDSEPVTMDELIQCSKEFRQLQQRINRDIDHVHMLMWWNGAWVAAGLYGAWYAVTNAITAYALDQSIVNWCVVGGLEGGVVAGHLVMVWKYYQLGEKLKEIKEKVNTIREAVKCYKEQHGSESPTIWDICNY